MAKPIPKVITSRDYLATQMRGACGTGGCMAEGSKAEGHIELLNGAYLTAASGTLQAYSPAQTAFRLGTRYLGMNGPELWAEAHPT